MISVVIPAHNEDESIAPCLESLTLAARCEGLKGEKVLIVVALDSCTDKTERIARRMGVSTVAVAARNVGAARARGARFALNAGSRWLSFTDADSTVASDWFSKQLSLDSDAVCGTVAVKDWGSYSPRMRRRYDAHYTDADGHRHIHGANLGVSAHAYVRAGGFKSLKTSEDVALVHALHDSGASIAWSAAPRVVTSSRRRFRAPDGFGATLHRMERESSHDEEDKS